MQPLWFLHNYLQINQESLLSRQKHITRLTNTRAHQSCVYLKEAFTLQSAFVVLLC